MITRRAFYILFEKFKPFYSRFRYESFVSQMRISMNNTFWNLLKVHLLCMFLLFASGCAVFKEQAARTWGDSLTSHDHACLPERIILNLTENPAESMAVTWRTCAKEKVPMIQIALFTKSPYFEENAETIHAESEIVRLENKPPVYHYSAVFKELIPDTVYAYRVGAEDNWSEWNRFRTASKRHAPFTFVYFGDPQKDVKSKCSHIFRSAYNNAPKADFWLFVGDLVDNGDRDEEWAEFFYALGWIPGMTPMILLPGNHEYPDKRFLKGKTYKLFHLWRPQFTLPENGPRGLEETAYFVDYQGARFVMLNGNEKLEEQAEWLGKILSNNPQRWTIVGIHQPFYSVVRYRKDSRSQDILMPLLDKYSVDLVLQGHEHIYCRTHKMKDGVRVRDHEMGTVYVTSVSGPKFYKVKKNNNDLMAKMETGRQLFQVIHVDHNHLLYASFDARGEVFDSFIIKK
jgi:3',5'-cyclic AMP phosphodiesterase CpdA